MPATSNSPVISDIQQNLGLKGNDVLFSKIRESASELLEAAGILLSSATSQTVRAKKRQVATNLEQLYPDIFGVVPGVMQASEQQKTTSYALLTSAMDLAKRGQRKRKAEESPAPEISNITKRVDKGARASASAAVKPTPWTVSPPPNKPPPPTEGAFPSKKPVPRDVSSPTPPKPPALSEHIPSSLGPVDVRVVIIKFNLDFLGPLEQCRVQFCDLVDQLDPEQPLMRKLHDCLREDGLLWDPERYTIIDTDSKAVRNNRGLRCALNSQAAKGVREAEWSIQSVASNEQSLVKVEQLNTPESIIAFTNAP